MHGVGIYIYPDGVRYDGQYDRDKKQGYGLYRWTDGRLYEGWWFNGKQHGLGRYVEKDKGSRFGLWEHGKRLRWFDANETSQIISRKLDFTQYLIFKDEESLSSINAESTFAQPPNYASIMAKVKLALNIPNL